MFKTPFVPQVISDQLQAQKSAAFSAMLDPMILRKVFCIPFEQIKITTELSLLYLSVFSMAKF